MTESVLSAAQIGELEQIYAGLEREYARVAGVLGLSCQGCPDNCCDSYFLHHSYVEWAYFRLGLSQLPEPRQERVRELAGRYLRESARLIAAGERPQLMCPLNDEGLCQLYSHRLLVCRTHGVPARMRRPDGQVLRFPGCFRCQEIVAGTSAKALPEVDRSAFFHRLARLEREFRQQHRPELPRLRLTIAEMLLQGPPGTEQSV